MTRIATIVACALCAPVLAQLDSDRAPSASSLATVSSNGRLLVGLDDRGRVSLFRWPSPSFHDQLSYRLGEEDATAPASHGAQWGIGIGPDVAWLSDRAVGTHQRYESSRNSSMITTGTLPGGVAQFEQRSFVHPGQNVFVTHLRVTGLTEAPEIYWHANFTPCTRFLPELPIADSLLDDLNDFAAFVLRDEKQVVHFRPKAPSSEMWNKAEGLATEGDPRDEWTRFPDGVWIAYTSPQQIQAYFVGAGVEGLDGVANALRAAPGARAAIGDTHSAIRITPEKTAAGYEAVIYTAIGIDYADAASALNFAKARGADTMHQDLTRVAAAFHRSTKYPAAADEALRAAIEGCLIVIANSTDITKWGIVRGPSIEPAWARDWPRHGAWISYALDLAGHHDIAQRHALFYRDLIRTEYRPSKPLGSMPYAVYADGTDATPHLIVDAETVAWTLWTFQQHAQMLDGPARAEFIESIADSVERAGDFLARWIDTRSGAPLYAPDPLRLSDPKSRAMTVTYRLGMKSATGIFRRAGRSIPPAWRQTTAGLTTLLRVVALDKTWTWTPAERLPFSIRDIISPKDPRFDHSVRARLDALRDPTGPDAARLLCELAMLWRDSPDRLEELRPYVLPVIRASMFEDSAGAAAPAFPDALTAAYNLVSALLIFPEAAIQS